MDAAQPLEVLPDKWAHGVKIFSRPTGLASWGAAGSGASPSARPERPADGIPLAVRELFDMAGLVTTYGSIKFAEHVPEHTAAAVTRLEAAGYAAVGKTNLHQFAYGISSRTRISARVPNPDAPRRGPIQAFLSESPARGVVASLASSRATASCRSMDASRSPRASTT